MSKRTCRLAPWTLLAGELLLVAPLVAQRITGQIRGKISDPALAALPGVTVELASDNIIGTRTTVTTNLGHYRFITLPPGFYNLTFRHPGFKTEELRHVRVAVGTTTRKNVTLNLAALADSVDVTAEMTRAAGLPRSDERFGRLNAGKRVQNQQEAPVSIAAFDASAFENRTMYDLSDLADFTPNLEIGTTSSSGGASNTATVYIRGIGQTDTRLWFDPGVGIYLDGVYLARSQGGVLDLVAVEVVEVLRGPQITLFGKSTMGGAISLVTRKPNSDLTGHFELTTGSFDRLDGSARVSGGFSPSIFGSLSMASTHATGYTRSLATGEDHNDDDTDSVRLAWRWQASQSITVDWTGDGSRQRERGAATVLTGFPQGKSDLLNFYNTALTLVGRQPYDERWVTGNLRESHSKFPGFAGSDILGTSLDVHGLLSTNLSLRSITSYRQLNLSESKDLDGSPNDLANQSSKADQWQWSEEIRLSGLSGNGRLTWLLGSFYFEEHLREENSVSILGDLFEALELVPGPMLSPPGLPGFLCHPGPPPPGHLCYGGAGNPRNRFFLFSAQTLTIEPSTRSYSIFSEGTLDLSVRLTVTAGLRHNHEEKRLTLTSPSHFAPVSIKESWSSTTARFSLAFQATPDVMFYLRAANGFKSGGFSYLNSNLGLLQGPSPFDPERVRSYEAGFKAELFTNRLRVHAALFWNRYKDLQLNMVLSSDISAIKNAGKAEVKGFDAGLQARLSRNLHIDAGVGHIDAQYTGLEESVDGPTLDGALPWTPDWHFVVSPEYVVHLQEGSAIVLHADYTYKTRLFNDVANRVAQRAYGLINARASFILPTGTWEIYAYGTNLGDEEYKEHGFFFLGLGSTLAAAGRPREWGLGLKYRL